MRELVTIESPLQRTATVVTGHSDRTGSQALAVYEVGPSTGGDCGRPGSPGSRACARRSSVPPQALVPGARPSTTSLRPSTSGSAVRRSSLSCGDRRGLVSLLWGDTKAWQVAIHTIASVITTARRSAGERRAAQRRGRAGEAHVIAEALAALMASRAIEDHTLEEAVTRLRDAVVLEERH